MLLSNGALGSPKSILEVFKLDIHACKGYPEMKLQLEQIQDFSAKTATDIFAAFDVPSLWREVS